MEITGHFVHHFSGYVTVFLSRSTCICQVSLKTKVNTDMWSARGFCLAMLYLGWVMSWLSQLGLQCRYVTFRTVIEVLKLIGGLWMKRNIKVMVVLFNLLGVIVFGYILKILHMIIKSYKSCFIILLYNSSALQNRHSEILVVKMMYNS